ncbi:MAG: adenylate/guanylate cyclase domain-containing protein [Magnetospirillum sp.]|nr:adenylate/guanylate cyclase domain-containing protein [Magnetospirillum sp.]
MSDTLDTSYPIRRLFRRRVAPALLIAALVFVLVSWFAITRVELHIYLETTERRVQTTVNLARTLAPISWTRLVTEADPAAVLGAPEAAVLAHTLRALAKDGHVVHLKLFSNQGMTLFSTDTANIGVREENKLLRAVIASERSEIETTQRDKAVLYEIYIPIRDEATGRLVVFEVYEPSSVIDEIILESFAQNTLVPLLVLLAAGLWLDRLTGRAQADIDRRVDAQKSLRQQLERFVSSSAVGAARSSDGGAVESRRVGMTLFYSDVRDFTSLAEFRPPQETVAFLNTLMTIQVEAICRHDGDVDKMIGDAVLARFEGGDREARAVKAAQEVLTTLAGMSLARGIGIGLYDGEAILGAIGPIERQDFTVIGDSVNVAARLCSLAEAGELVIDELALRRSGLPDTEFSAPENQGVKGRAGILSLCRWRVGSLAPAPAP